MVTDAKQYRKQIVSVERKLTKSKNGRIDLGTSLKSPYYSPNINLITVALSVIVFV